ncbi:hypothetical protein OF829_20240 [Sphingomonas sp. LB-2]|nr:hypothetical protein [Sphingomonas caeni]
MEGLTKESFEPHIGTGFTIHTAELDEVFVLTEVTPGKPSYAGGREPFSLMFNGSSTELMFHSQLIVFEHPEMGGLAILVSPLGRNDDGTYRYEAVFN